MPIGTPGDSSVDVTMWSLRYPTGPICGNGNGLYGRHSQADIHSSSAYGTLDDINADDGGFLGDSWYASGYSGDFRAS